MRKPIVVLYIPASDFFAPTLPPSELMAAFNDSHPKIKMKESFNDYLWFVFVNTDLNTPELKVFHEKDYTEAQYDELMAVVKEGIGSLKK
jgi:hypothetical protein